MSYPHAYATRPLLRRLVGAYVGKYRSYLLGAALFMIVNAAATGATPYMLQLVIDDAFIAKDQTMLYVIALEIIGIFLCAGISDYGQRMFISYVGQKVVADMQGDLFSHLVHADLSTFHDQATGRLVSRFTNDIQLLRQTSSNLLVGLVKESLTMLALIGVMFYQSVELTLVAFFILVFAIFPILRLGKRMRKVADATQASLGDFTQQLDEVFLGVRVVKAYGREQFEDARVRQSTRTIVKHYMRAAKIGAAVGPIMEILGGLAIAAIIAYAGDKVIDGTMTTGGFTAFITAMIMAYRPIKVVASLNTQLQEGMAAAARFFAVIDKQPEIRNLPNAQPLQFSHGRIAFDAVTFHYPGTDATGIHALSFTVPAGATVALVGPSGGGKSTLMNLLLRFYEPQSGRITIDGQDIRDVTLVSLRAVTALVSQEVVLFDDTVRANIAYGRLDASEAEIVSAARQAYAHEFIQSLPQGYDTLIGPQGVKLSGGQRQRLSIARAILKNAPILLLDEATSALDNESERAVQRALNELMRGRTTLVVAHRLSTVQHASSIMVLNQGRLAEHGTHEQLLARSGLYHRLYHTQFETASPPPPAGEG